MTDLMPMTEINLKIVHATALEPGKVYLLEIARHAFYDAVIHALLKQLHAADVRVIAIKSVDGQSLRIVEVTQEKPKLTNYVTAAGETSNEAVAAASERQEDL